MTSRRLRDWIARIDSLGELHVSGAHWDLEIGTISRSITAASLLPRCSSTTSSGIHADSACGQARSATPGCGGDLSLDGTSTPRAARAGCRAGRQWSGAALRAGFVGTGPILENVVHGRDVA
jgi:hypothetical protein